MFAPVIAFITKVVALLSTPGIISDAGLVVQLLQGARSAIDALGKDEAVKSTAEFQSLDATVSKLEGDWQEALTAARNEASSAVSSSGE